MKRYLNRQEKSQAQVLGGFVNWLSELTDQLVKYNRPKEMIKYARTAKTFTDKVLECFIKGLDPLEVVKVGGELNKMRVTVQYKTEAVREFEALKKADGIVPVKTEEFLDIVDHALVVCQSCPFTGDQVEGCGLRKAMLSYNVEPFNFKASVGVCCYKQVCGVE